MDCNGKPDCECKPCDDYRARKLGLIEGGQGRTDQDLENDASNGSIAFTGFMLLILAVIIMSMLTGCTHPAKRAIDATNAIPNLERIEK